MVSAPSKVCQSSGGTVSGVHGWWNGTSLSLTDLAQCTAADNPSGLHLLKYRHPANYSLPDEVGILLLFFQVIVYLLDGDMKDMGLKPGWQWTERCVDVASWGECLTRISEEIKDVER